MNPHGEKTVASSQPLCRKLEREFCAIKGESESREGVEVHVTPVCTRNRLLQRLQMFVPDILWTFSIMH